MTYRGGRVRCPGCAALMHDASRDPDARLHCSACGGSFVAHRALRDEAGIAAALQAGRSSLPPSPLGCPICAVPMRSMIVESRRGDARLSFCNAHGVWLATPELAREF